MKKTLIVTFILLAGLLHLNAQQPSKFPAIDKSPMDACYYPVNYPVLKIQDKATEPLLARVLYSRPQKAGRTIFGELIEYGKVWRLGANEATEIEFFKEVRIAGKKIPKGRYTLYAVVNKDKWTMIINKETDTWGSFKYDAKKDLLRTDVPVEQNNEILESMAMNFEKTSSGFSLIIAWDTIKVTLPISK